MEKLLAIVAVIAVSVGLGHSAYGQQAQSKGVPVEFFACNWEDGKGMEDLKKVGEKFSEWAGKNDSSYSAWILTPQFHSGLDFDFGWLGSWPDANAMGKSMDTWLSGGSELADDFGKVMKCHSHEMATSVAINAPKGPPGNGIVMFSPCSMVEGKMPGEAVAAHQKVGAMMKDMGSKASSWIFYPGLGAGDIDFDYWQVLAFNNYAEMGAATEMYINGGGWKKAMGVLQSVSHCKSGTLFDAHLVRAGARP